MFPGKVLYCKICNSYDYEADITGLAVPAGFERLWYGIDWKTGETMADQYDTIMESSDNTLVVGQAFEVFDD